VGQSQYIFELDRDMQLTVLKFLIKSEAKNLLGVDIDF
jgi:hypothetical protein